MDIEDARLFFIAKKDIFSNLSLRQNNISNLSILFWKKP
jgi:hypothetical protein